MIDVRTQDVLEWNEVLRLIARRAFSPLGREYVEGILPCETRRLVEYRQAPIADLIRYLADNNSLPLGGLEDLRPVLAIAHVEGSVLEIEHWGPMLTFLEISRELKELREGIQRRYLSLTTLLSPIEEYHDLEVAINRTFDDNGQVRDNASPELHAARMALRSMQQKLQRTVSRMVSEFSDRGLLQEQFSTIRNGRHVFPVKQSARGRLQGILHGSSASGETAYVEPMEIVEISNEMETVRENEQREVMRILRGLTTMVRNLLPLLQTNLRIIGELDGLHAIAATAVDKGWNIPIVLDEGAFRLFNAHHPLLNLRGGRSVPITMLLDPGDRCVILSGPNAGGKTTAMKTIGLLALLVACGMPIPAFPDSTIPLFSNVLADIGDTQNLAEGLSTFSGHIRRIREIWDQSGRRTLVLLDELGTGTDPQEGGAIALSLLEALHQRAGLTVTTSHLNPVKQWAEDTAGARNASFSLDPGTHEPTFRLRLDLPGASEALEIAQREGLPESVLVRARGLVGERHLRMGELLRRIEERERALSHAAREAEARAKSLGEQEQIARARVESLRQERREWREAALRERETEIARVREKMEKLIADLPSEETLSLRREALLRARTEALRDQQLSVAERRRIAEVGEEKGDFFAGQKVYVRRVGQWGDLVSFDPEKKKARVQLGKLEMLLPVADLMDHDPEERRLEQEEKIALLENRDTGKKRKSKKLKNALRNATEYSGPAAAPPVLLGGRIFSGLTRANSMTLDLHGFRVEEAITELDRFLDQSLLSSFPYVKICHGTGSGRLYKAVHEYLRQHRSVRKFRFAGPDEGGGGVTVVDL